MTEQSDRHYRYFKVCPRGFANEVTYYRVPRDKVAECESEYANYEDSNLGNHAHCGWTTDTKAHWPGVAVDWADRNW